MRRSFDCPECNEVGFIVVRLPDIVRCLYCGCEWQFALPGSQGRPVFLMQTRKSLEYALVLARYVARFHVLPPSIYTEEAATQLMLAALERDTPIQTGGIITATEDDPDKSQ